MNGLIRRFFTLAALLSAALLCGACVLGMPSSNYPQREARAKQLTNIVLVTPDITINSLSAGGVKEERPAWSEAGRKHIEKAATEVLEQKGRKARLLSDDGKSREEIEEIRTLQEAVMQSIYVYASYNPENPNFFMNRYANFDYSLGSVEKLLKANKADGLLLVRGQDNISTGGRKALGVIRAINPFDSGQQSGMTWVEAVLTDRSGDILWYNLNWNAGGYDLREEDEARKFVQMMFRDFPGEKP